MSKFAKGLKLYHVNARSISGRVSELQLLYSHADFICCSETWLDNRVDNTCINIRNTTCLRRDRKSNDTDYKIHNIGGDLCIYVFLGG